MKQQDTQLPREATPEEAARKKKRRLPKPPRETLFSRRRKHRKEPRRAHAWRGVRTAVIAILLALNLVLLAALGAAKGYDAILRHKTRLQMDSMLAQQGVLCGSSVYQTLETCPQTYTLRADGSVQRALAEELLTGKVTDSAKGSTVLWTGDNGTVQWSQAGELTANVELPEVTEPQDTDQAAKIVCDLLSQAGIRAKTAQTETTQDDSGYTVTVRQEIDGTELFGCQIQVRIGTDHVYYFDGMWCTGETEPLTISALADYSPEQTLFRFLSAGSGAGEIISVQPAYVLSDRSGGRFATIPCWRFTTDQGDFLLNILNGEMIAAESIDAAETGADGDTADTQTTDTTDGTDSTDSAPNTSGTDDTDSAWDDTQSDTQTGAQTDDPSADATDEDLWDVEG